VITGLAKDYVAGGIVALFYRESDQAEWKFFAGHQDRLSCENFMAREVMRAFADTRCYDYSNSKETTVKEHFWRYFY
jgi:hypothetical protein